LFLIGGVNLVNLLLIRASGRAKEFAVRQALGAGRWHVVRDLLIETMVLAVAGGMLGLAVGAVGIRLLAMLAPTGCRWARTSPSMVVWRWWRWRRRFSPVSRSRCPWCGSTCAAGSRSCCKRNRAAAP